MGTDSASVGPTSRVCLAGRPVGVARTVGQAIEVDGVTHVSPFDGLAPGQFVTVEIEDAEEYDLIARVV